MRTIEFTPMFPTSTAGHGGVVSSNRRNGSGQGRPSNNKRVACGICGFTGTNLNHHNKTGGDFEGNGAGGVVTKTAADSNGGPHGDQTYNVGAGCPLCFSSNYVGRKSIKKEPNHKKPSGFEKL